ncbi:MAG: hypothetical protein NTU91_15700 [Chloroflexi bacterium]|nr:hypothetical protein [Chloroflexota bacterium]
MDTRSWNLLRSRVLAPFVVLLLAAGLAACNLPAGSDCDADHLPAAINMHPAWGTFVDSLSPTLTWDYAGTCEPDAFHIRLDGGAETQDATVDGRSMAWTPPVRLEPATDYTWTIRAVSGSTEGDYGTANFRTGPMCDPSDPASTSAPELTSPADGAMVTDTVSAVGASGEVLSTGFRVDLDWEAPTGCLLAHGYRVDLSRSPSFAAGAGVDSWDEANPPMMYWSLWEEWHDCERYYWRVSALLDYDLTGSPSETRSFVVNTTGVLCPMELEPELPLGPGIGVPLTGHGAIAGHVWHDECAVPYESTDVAPPGCVIMPDGGMEANGILDSGETGIEGVTVRLGAGACPGTGGWSYTTDANGMYTFHNLTAGTYCLEIDAAADGNDSVLIPGNWTVPYRWYGPGPISVEVTLGSDDDISRLNDFAWDYQFLPSPSGAVPSGTPFARVLTDARCRLGPGTNYPILTYLSQGQSFPITGRFERGGWWQLRAADIQLPCWIAEDVVEPTGDLENVPFAIPPAAPTVMPTEEPPSPAQGCRCLQTNCIYAVPCPGVCTLCP